MRRAVSESIEAGDMTDVFYNPYHFVPVERGELKEDAGRFRQHGPDDGLRHDRYADGRQSGRLICRISLETPIVIGREQTSRGRDRATTVSPFLFDGYPAIPGSSLKGMVSSLLEAASASALRVLGDEEKPVSYRNSMEESLSALGFLRKRGDHWFIEPLAMPNLICLDADSPADRAIIDKAPDLLKREGRLHCPPNGLKPPALSRSASAKILCLPKSDVRRRRYDVAFREAEDHAVFESSAHAILPSLPCRLGDQIQVQGSAGGDA